MSWDVLKALDGLRENTVEACAVLASLLAVSALLASAPSAAGIDSVVRETMARERIAGVSLAIARSGEIETARGYGVARTSPRVDATAATVYPIGSITKQFTVAATLREIHAGRIGAADLAFTLLPQYAPWPAITLENLLQQTSGIVSYNDVVTSAQVQSPRDIALAVARAPLRFVPGSQYEYSNSNALLLGILLEKLERRTYADIIHSWFTGPLELRETSYLAQAALTTQGYDDAGKPVRLEPPGYLFSAAGMTSNVRDLIRWEDALYAGSVVSEPDTARLFNGMAATARTMDGRDVYYQTGNVTGYSSIVLHQTHAHLTIAVLTNRDRLDLLPLVKSIVRIYDPPAEHAQ